MESSEGGREYRGRGLKSSDIDGSFKFGLVVLGRCGMEEGKFTEDRKYLIKAMENAVELIVADIT